MAKDINPSRKLAASVAGASVCPGFWWARHKDGDKPTVVQVSVEGDKLRVAFIGSLSWPTLSEIDADFKFLKLIAAPD